MNSNLFDFLHLALLDLSRFLFFERETVHIFRSSDNKCLLNSVEIFRFHFFTLQNIGRFLIEMQAAHGIDYICFNKSLHFRRVTCLINGKCNYGCSIDGSDHGTGSAVGGRIRTLFHLFKNNATSFSGAKSAKR